MTRSQWLQGSAIFAAAIIAGALSSTYVDRRFTANAEAPAITSEPCVMPDGTWRNWPHANVPMLSPKCEDAK
jgi:hypothetical protein